MLSRYSNLLRLTNNLRITQRSKPNLNSTRLSHAVWYREHGKASKGQFLCAEILGAVAWWWVLWHIYHEPEHLLGEFDIPDPSKWTDEELGIPPDDVD